MIKIYIGEVLPDVPYTEILYPNLGDAERENPFGEKVFEYFKEPVVEIVKDAQSADYLCLPHNFNYIKSNIEYLHSFVELAEKYSKKILIFFPGDSDEEVHVPNAIIFRNSEYGYKKKDNEIIMPAYAVDLGRKYRLLERKKEGILVVGFCGWATYASFREWTSYIFFNLIQSLIGESAKKKGLYFRRAAISVLKKSADIKTNFIIRSSYSGNAKTLAADPTVARAEYVDTIKNSDFTLAPKGDGNFSVRFYEALSLGRIPLMIDTDCVLPLDLDIDYKEYLPSVPHREIGKLPAVVKDFYEKIPAEEYLARQKELRRLFDEYLRIDSFFKFMFLENNIERYANSQS
jgi:hypothetical protein